jgi:SNF2 family DNA or RNA helicase
MNYKFKTKPYQHQLIALEKSWNRETYAYFMEMGTGKTKVLIDNVAMLYDKGKIDGLLVIAPKGVIGTWHKQELPAHLPDHINNVSTLWQANITKAQSRKLGNLFKTGEELHILIMNVEAFSTGKGLDFAKKFLLSHKTLMAIDESTTIKNPKAIRTKNIIHISDMAKYRRILTGAPVTKNPLDLFSQCFFLDPYHLDHASYYSFRTRYAIMKTAYISGRSIQLVSGFKHLDELAEKIKPFSYRVLKEDCLDLPPKIYMKRNIDLSTEQKKVYKEMKEKALANLHGKQITTMTALTQLMRLQQITCGHFVADDGTTQQIKSNRLNELMDILDEVEGKAIIWAQHREAFQNDSKVRYLVGTPQTGGYGITLHAANTVIYYSNGYDLEKRLQSEDRAHRIGQHKPVTYIDILAEETVDEKIVKALRKKINIASEVMGEELREWI